MEKYFSSINFNTLSLKTPQYLLAFFLFIVILPACRVKEGCAANQKSYTNNMERTKKRGKTSLFPKSISKKIKH